VEEAVAVEEAAVLLVLVLVLAAHGMWA